MVKRFAHTLPDRGPDDWEPIQTHLDAVATTAKRLASDLGLDRESAERWAETIALWHDLGKYATGFQKKLFDEMGYEAHLEGPSDRVFHSAAGAQHAIEAVPRIGRLLSYVIAGHHSGLGDAENIASRLVEDAGDWRDHAPESMLAAPALEMPPVMTNHRCGKRLAFQFAFFTRMLFSCLIDADRLETERFCDPRKAATRTAPREVKALCAILEPYLDRLSGNAEPTRVNAQRSEILGACRAAAELAPGFFSLTVPTGGGKTLASLSFALRHAVEHDRRRVIVAIPFTSIIEQTANKYREVFGDLGEGVVVEHHSNTDPTMETYRNRLATENWDAPLVVTTNVQLFETLFANRTTICRKLHRIAGSVIILDEAQTLPVGLLRPCLHALRELVTDYGCTVVLCTATQPALQQRDDFFIGLEGVREIIPQPAKLHAAMRRVESHQLGEIDDEALLDRLQSEVAWLTIVNTKAHAASLYGRLAGESPPDDLFHLSTNLCGQHRSDRIVQIRQRLKDGLPCRVVSTQLIEAGVDVDFPMVFRAMAGIDSIAQAAGRCNREGRLPGLGKLYLFDPAEVQPKGYLGATAATTRELLPDYPDPLDPEAVHRYFELHYWKRAGDNRWDDNDVLACFPPGSDLYYDFKSAAERFRLIEEATQTVFVPYGEGAKLIEQLRAGEVDRFLLRKLQRYSVGLRDWQCQTLVTSGDIETLPNGFLALANADLYDDNLGLRSDRPGWRDAESNIV